MLPYDTYYRSGAKYAIVPSSGCRMYSPKCRPCTEWWISSLSLILILYLQGIGMQTYNKIKTSRALAGLPSHISSAKVAQLFRQHEEEDIEDQTDLSYQAKAKPQTVFSHHQETETKDKERSQQPKPRERQRADVFGPMVMTQNSKTQAEKLNRPKTASQKQRSNYGPQRSSYSSPDDHDSTKKACYQAEHLYLPVLAACLVSCVLGWLIRDRVTDDKEVIAFKGETFPVLTSSHQNLSSAWDQSTAPWKIQRQDSGWYSTTFWAWKVPIAHVAAAMLDLLCSCKLYFLSFNLEYPTSCHLRHPSYGNLIMVYWSARCIEEDQSDEVRLACWYDLISDLCLIPMF